MAATTGATSGSATSGPPDLQPTAASETRISGEEFNARPAARVGELLEAVPGLIVTQHSGEGKANQYFLRGFNLDHGTDLAITVDGMPVNMPTHGHGQGYADINFLIPELVGAVNVRKGPYFADKGDFASAGSVDIDYLGKLPKNLAEITFGSFGYQRGVAAGSTAVGTGTLLAAVEGIKYNGPWDVPDNVRKLNGVLRYSQGTATDGFTLSAMGYSNGWNSTDQVAQRAIDQNIIGRFGTLDATDGGTSSRFSLSSNWAHSSEFGQSKANAYVVRSAMQLFNNFTYLLDDPVNGDQFSQLDRRTLYGFNASHSFDWRFSGIETQTRVGLNTRGDDIHVGLFRTLQRTTLSTVREDHRQGRQRSACGRIPRRAGPTGCGPRSGCGRIISPAMFRAIPLTIPAMLPLVSPARRPVSCWAPGTAPNSTAMPATACTPTTSAAPPSRSIPTTR